MSSSESCSTARRYCSAYVQAILDFLLEGHVPTRCIDNASAVLVAVGQVLHAGSGADRAGKAPKCAAFNRCAHG
jgi:hypothetical protein